jgi:benzil reductase ((S)-benzoin forming)
MGSTFAVITGASRGIGAGIALAAQQDGATVAVCNRSASTFARQLAADLAKPASWLRFTDWITELVEELQPDRLVFVHNAAMLTPIGFAGEVDPDDYTTNVLLNSAAPQVLGDAVARLGRTRGVPTTIVQLSSGAGTHAYPGWSSYCAAKAAVDKWVESVGLEQAERDDHVRALSISPGLVATDMQAEIRESATQAFPEVGRFRDLYEEGELADPQDIGQRIWDLSVSDRWSNGDVLDIRQLDT